MKERAFFFRLWPYKDRRGSRFELHVRTFILLAILPLVLVLLVAGSILLREMDEISLRTGAVRGMYLPSFLESHRVAVNIESLRRYASLVYMADSPKTRRDARITAMALATEMGLTRDTRIRDEIAGITTRIMAIEKMQSTADQDLRKADQYIERAETSLHTLARRLAHDAPLGRKLDELRPVMLLLASQMARTPDNLRHVHNKTLAELDALTQLSLHEPPEIGQTLEDMRHALQQSFDVRTQAFQSGNAARLAWQEVDHSLRELRDRLNVNAVDLTHNTLLAIDKHAAWMERTVYFSFVFMMLVLVLLLVLLHLFIVRPIMRISNKLLELRTGRESIPVGNMHIAELNEVATLINMSSEQLSVMYQHTRELEREKEQIRNIAITDALTGLYNRRYFDMQLKMLHDEAMFKREAMSIAMMDIDLFKVYNDSLGHSAGDDCLVRVAAAIRGSLHRKTDMAFRYGGEEFVVLLPGCVAEAAQLLAERIRTQVQELGIVHPDSPVSPVVTISVGVSTFLPDDPVDGKTLLNRADQALYQAKKQGRNMVCSAG